MTTVEPASTDATMPSLFGTNAWSVIACVDNFNAWSNEKWYDPGFKIFSNAFKKKFESKYLDVGGKARPPPTPQFIPQISIRPGEMEQNVYVFFFRMSRSSRNNLK